MVHLHIFNNTNTKFSEPYIDFINKNFSINKHLFILIGKEKIKIPSRENVKQISFTIKGISLLILNLYKVERIILHGLFDIRIVVLLFFQPKLLKKCYWIVWGGDLYAYRKTKSTLKMKVMELLRAYVIKRFGHVVTLVRGDYYLAKEWYGIKGEYHHGAYVNPISKKYLDSLPSIKKEENDPIVIQIGNSADPTNNHIDVLNSLKKFKEKNIKIFAPLSYGNKEYAQQVIEEGKKLFGDKFIPLTEFLTPDKYSAYLNNIDISIFNNDRQQGLFNICALAYLNKKIYLRDNVTSYDHLLNEGLQLYNMKDLDGISFNEFVGNEKKGNKEKIEKLFNNDHLKGIWEAVFKDEKE